MKYEEIIDLILSERNKIDETVNDILKQNSSLSMRPDTPPVDLKYLEKNKSIFIRE